MQRRIGGSVYEGPYYVYLENPPARSAEFRLTRAGQATEIQLSTAHLAKLGGFGSYVGQDNFVKNGQ